MKIGLKEELIKQLLDIFIQFDTIDSVSVYGSRAKGNFREGSDVDLCFKGKLDTKTLHKISIEIDELMSPYSYDLSIYHQIKNEELLEHINRVGIILYKRSKK